MTISLGPVFGGPGFSPRATCRYFGVSDDKSDRLMRADLTGHNLEEFCGALGRWDGHMMASACRRRTQKRLIYVDLIYIDLVAKEQLIALYNIPLTLFWIWLQYILEFLGIQCSFCTSLQELVEDVHLGGITIDAENKHVYWTAAWQSHNIDDPGKKLASLYGKLMEDRPTPFSFIDDFLLMCQKPGNFFLKRY